MKKRLFISGAISWTLMILMGLAHGAEGQPAKELGKKTVDGLEVTLVTGPPLSPAQMKEMMKKMGGRKMMGKGEMPMMEAPSEPPTHQVGVIIVDEKTGKLVPGLKVTLTAKGPVTRTAELFSMPGSYGKGFSLKPGQYDVNVRIDFPEKKRKPAEVRFRMKV